ncbi:hypothetical protein SEA_REDWATTLEHOG_179 [Gordonia phage RedWattleHog]|uniref:Uncharacterized protein n=1 Tax=Gordonia phage Stormageddon TaxID=2656541 RepID=A0A649VR92_9CAUD|nr:hypothetical protein KHQ86_gp120 [Gordonia phage Stormageddon]QGJ95040.1 hypothetical protein SEA_STORMAGEDDON_180 [Gordonia phage Stormageddon]QLF83682.1 hypothetical protein SEA_REDWATTLEHOG_179 [Gordonia phage RedWattleHog]
MNEVWAVTESGCPEECCNYVSGTTVVALFDNKQAADQLADRKGYGFYSQRLRVYHAPRDVPEYLRT